jgi:hypothetical protein
MSAEERIATLEAEMADLERRFRHMAVYVAGLVVHHELPDVAALSGPGAGQGRPAHLRLVDGAGS